MRFFYYIQLLITFSLTINITNVIFFTKLFQLFFFCHKGAIARFMFRIWQLQAPTV